MSCVWISLARGLKLKKSPAQLLALLKEKNTPTVDVVWKKKDKPLSPESKEGQEECKRWVLSDKAQEEHEQWINEVEISGAGYICAACDPFLLLVSQVFNVTIIHHYAGNTFIFENTRSSTHCITLRSSKSHMSFVSRTACVNNK